MIAHELRRLAESFRARATAVEAKHGKEKWTQTINVIEAFEQCAVDVEQIAAGLAETCPAPASNPS